MPIARNQGPTAVIEIMVTRNMQRQTARGPVWDVFADDQRYSTWDANVAAMCPVGAAISVTYRESRNGQYINRTIVSVSPLDGDGTRADTVRASTPTQAAPIPQRTTVTLPRRDQEFEARKAALEAAAKLEATVNVATLLAAAADIKRAVFDAPEFPATEPTATTNAPTANAAN